MDRNTQHVLPPPVHRPLSVMANWRASILGAGSSALAHREPAAQRNGEAIVAGVLDVVFHDDLMRLRTDHEPKNMATIKHRAMNLLRSASDKDSLKTCRKAAAWNHDYLRAILTQTA